MIEEICKILRKTSLDTKIFSILLLILALVDHLSNPLEHSTLTDSYLVETLIRGWFFFVGIFSLLGNGKTEKIRLFLISTPFLYLGMFYIINYIETRTGTLVLPSIIFTYIGLYLLVKGVAYELKQRICSRFANIVYNADNELAN